MEAIANESANLNELKIEARNITRLMSNARRIHPSKWMKRVRLDLITLLNLKEAVSDTVMFDSIIMRLNEALASLNEARKISKSEQLTHLREYIVRILEKFSKNENNCESNSQE